MKKIYNNFIPFKGYLAMTVWPFIFIRKELTEKYTEKVHRHESIHAKQQLETLWVLFFVLYALEYVIKLILCGDMNRAYKSISFEQEAFSNENDVNYLEKRKLWSWIKYVFKMKKRTPF